MAPWEFHLGGVLSSRRIRALVAGISSIGLISTVLWVFAGPAAAQCAYSGAFQTTTSVVPAHTTVPFGGRDKITATVYSGDGAAPGNFVFKLNGVKKKTVALTTLDANHSVAVWWLPRNLPAGSVDRIVGVYPGTCPFGYSAQAAYVDVVKVGTTTTVTLNNTPAVGVHPKATLDVTSKTHKRVSGYVVLKMFRDGTRIQRKKVQYSGKAMDFRMKSIAKAGSYKIVAHYLRSKNFKASSGSVSFTV